jgi:DNA-binding transcriptional MerR regulator
MAKGPDAFRTISEAADEIGVPQHVLRFWETKFSFIRPMKRAGGRRFYRRQDVEVLIAVRSLLHGQGYTIKGVQQLHRQHGMKTLLGMASGSPPPVNDEAEPPPPAYSAFSDGAKGRLTAVLNDLESVKRRIDALLQDR